MAEQKDKGKVEELLREVVKAQKVAKNLWGACAHSCVGAYAFSPSHGDAYLTYTCVIHDGKDEGETEAVCVYSKSLDGLVESAERMALKRREGKKEGNGNADS
jgi:hypothetical protein